MTARAYQSDDVAALHSINALQAGLSAPQTFDSLTAAMNQLTNLGRQYAAVHDAALRTSIEALFTSLAATQTSFGELLPGLYAAFAYGQYLPDNHTRDGSPSSSMWPVFVHGGDRSSPPWARPAGPPSWRTAIDTFLTKYPDQAHLPPLSLVDPGDNSWNSGPRVIQHQLTRVDPANWNNAQNAATAIDAVWAQQETDVRAMVGTDTLQSSDAIHLLYGLLGLASGTPRRQALAYVVANALSDSPERPNSTLLAQLAYFVLMALVDPMGAVRWTHAQATAFAKDAANARGEAPVVLLLRRVFGQELKFLEASPSYPLVDPYSRATFNVRQANALAAINATLKSLTPSRVDRHPGDGPHWTQNDSDVAAKLVRFESELVHPASKGLWNAMAMADALANASGGVSDPLLGRSVDPLFGQLVTAPMSDQATFLELYVAAAYGRFAEGRGNQNLSGLADKLVFYVFRTALDTWSEPKSPPSWSAALVALFGRWTDTQLPPAKIWKRHANTWGDIGRWQRQLLDGATWVDKATPPPPVAKAIAAQADALRAAAGQRLTPDTCLAILHLLPSFILGAAPERDFAKRIATSPAPSDEYPDVTFARQLVYLVAMTLVDPFGVYQWSHDQVRTLLQLVRDLYRGDDPATAAMLDGLTYHITLFDADPAYPLSDPYSSETLPVRQTDTLAALNAAWKKIQ